MSSELEGPRPHPIHLVHPILPAAGNHENGLGNGPIGYQAYQTYFSLPPATDQTDLTHGLWYAFTVGSMRVISIANDDVVYQDGGDSYVRGYSKGATILDISTPRLRTVLAG